MGLEARVIWLSRTPLVGFGVSEPVKEPAQEGGGVQISAGGGFAGSGRRRRDVLG